MDYAYDHIQEEILATSDNNTEHDISRIGGSPATAASSDGRAKEEASAAINAPAPSEPARPERGGSVDLSSEFQETFRAISQNPWGQKIGGFWNNVRQKGETVYKEATKEYNAASEEAAKGLSGLKDTIVRQTRALSLGGGTRAEEEVEAGASEGPHEKSSDTDPAANHDQRGADDSSFLTKFRDEAAKRLKDIQRAEDAADEALARWGSNVASLFKDAISVTAPNESSTSGGVLFESRDGDGKRIIHASRLEAQLHVIHTSPERMLSDPDSQAWPEWQRDFKVDDKTADIAKDLEAYPVLRKAMEAVVPEKVQYGDFWKRYYFLRHIVETEERRRAEILKGAAAEADEEEVGWDNDSDDEDAATTPRSSSPKPSQAHPPGKERDATAGPEAQRPSLEQSIPDSDASYDIVSGAATASSGTPKGTETPVAAPSQAAAAKQAPAQKAAAKDDESSDEDWE